ncbi:unnamed protein product [Polarella glacialis]|uniref:HMG box domain-containing protein n=1 Tax=Polarella glacialis TaxID=89957 RepID=A0A813E2Z0_POLGL|nr:unnamed protein product [Polarella glacialis]CAE8646211.1 unnamed protein product [Polarella glacialis]
MEEPKKPTNPYWIWLGENRDALTKEAGSGKGSVVGKLAGEKWKALPAAQKVPFEKKAADLKKQYVKDMEEFKKGGGEAGKRRADKKALKDEKGSKKAKKNDPNRPKKPQTGYFLWLNENRAALMKEIPPGGKVTDVSKLGGAKWKAMSDDKKEPYQKKAAVAKAAYDKVMVEYKKTNGGGGDDEEDEEEAEE